MVTEIYACSGNVYTDEFSDTTCFIGVVLISSMILTVDALLAAKQVENLAVGWG